MSAPSSPSGPPTPETPTAPLVAAGTPPAALAPAAGHGSAHGAAHAGTHGDEPHLHPEHFTLSPDVARLPLARRRQRLGAILVDLALVGVLSLAFSSLALLAGAFAGTLLYWAAGRPFAPTWMRQKTTRIALAFALCIAFIGVGRMVTRVHEKQEAQEKAREDEEEIASDARERAEGRHGESPITFNTLGLGAGELMRLATTTSPEEARALAEKLGARVKKEKDPARAAGMLLEMVDNEDVPISDVSRAELTRVLSPLAGAPAQPVAAPADAAAAGAAPDPHLAELATLQRRNLTLAAQVARLDKTKDRLEEELKEAQEEHGIRHFLMVSVHDLGFGIGWSYVYFIGFLVLWKGHTPGKRLFGIRVVRIDGRPMTLWRSFERFHGYAASMLTGFMGFIQVMWDPSRQCLHDKVAETVVVQDRHHETDAVVR
ncbi:RDD family protein [Aggregicoccus sp. 17bor-14]|uniref:RDD family protein n=1 Tax=Myxococcaceae TaxID=31 RepID=UPI00129CA26C|nr:MULTISPECIES: RDD family protein [Myxococcaceae]MBF5041388.1 RDD family protein [Simulacricoccus sp. 17bor-14]MRI87172.1 RDD family protein [Aggregicoccus sp. 17bor-14]